MCFLFFSFPQLYCMFFFDLRLLINPLVFTSFSCIYLYLLVSNMTSMTWRSSRLTITRQMSLVNQELLTLNRQHKFTLVSNGTRIAQSLVFFVVFCLPISLISFGHCIVCPRRITASQFLFGVFKLFKINTSNILKVKCQEKRITFLYYK